MDSWMRRLASWRVSGVTTRLCLLVLTLLVWSPHMRCGDMTGRKKHINVSCPSLINAYNKNVGGVDKCDMLISLYRNSLQSKKWYKRIIFHMLDMTCECMGFIQGHQGLSNDVQIQVDCGQSSDSFTEAKGGVCCPTPASDKSDCKSSQLRSEV